MSWEIRRREWKGETVALDILEGSQMIAGVTIRGEPALSEKRAALISAAPDLRACVEHFIDEWGQLVDDDEDINGASAVEWISENMEYFRVAAAKAKGN